MQNWTYSEIFQKAWDSFKGNLAFTAGLTLVYFVAGAVLSYIPVLGWMLMGPLVAGYTQCLLRLRSSQSEDAIRYQDFFWGFLDFNRLIQIILLGVLVSIGNFLGFLLLIIPGIWFMVSTFLASTHFILFGGDAINSIKKSIEIVKQDWFKYFGFLILLGLVNLVGAICFLVGILVTIPLSILSVVILLESSSNVARPPSN